MITNARVALKALKALKPLSMNVSFASKKNNTEKTETEAMSEKSVKKAPAKKKAE